MNDIAFDKPIQFNIAKKYDGHLLTLPDGSCRYLNFIESLLWMWFNRIPKEWRGND
tara:strand:- start:347 stop:514 length:168 start_codon:yes stop_codon:yes gene_type:complete